jgi:hypothetical protein
MTWFKGLTEVQKGLVAAAALIATGFSGGVITWALFSTYRELPSKVAVLETRLSELENATRPIVQNGVKFGDSVSLVFQYESTDYQLDACLGCTPDLKADGSGFARPVYVQREGSTGQSFIVKRGE